MPKYCRYCGIELSIENTYKGRLEHRDYKCIICDNKQSKISYVKNKKLHAEYSRKATLKRRYGITVEEYNKMWSVQNGVCAICGQPETAIYNNVIKPLSVDHSHKTGKVRALLCHNCNMLLGTARDNPDILKNAIEYLERMG